MGISVFAALWGGRTGWRDGRYRGTWLSTGRAMSPQVVHIWRMAEGKAVAFQQHIDTLGVARAMGTA